VLPLFYIRLDCVGVVFCLRNDKLFLICKKLHFLPFTGANVSIRNCYVWDNTVIEDDCSLANTIICEQVRLYKNTRLLATSKDTMAMQNIDYVLGKGVSTA